MLLLLLWLLLLLPRKAVRWGLLLLFVQLLASPWLGGTAAAEHAAARPATAA
jgi:hypothetical protein